MNLIVRNSEGMMFRLVHEFRCTVAMKKVDP